MSEIEKAYVRLAKAVVLVAIKDYRHAIELLGDHPDNRDAKRTRMEVEDFFKSERFRILSDLDEGIRIDVIKEGIRIDS